MAQKKKTGFKDMDKTYHLVLTIEVEANLQTFDLFVNNLKGARAMFVEKIKELNPRVSKWYLDAALDEGWYKWNNGVVFYTEPYNIFGKE
jgi:hypothetical protein